MFANFITLHSVSKDRLSLFDVSKLTTEIIYSNIFNENNINLHYFYFY